MREIFRDRRKETSLAVVEGKVNSIRQKDITKTGCRIYKDGFMGVAGTLGEATEDTWKEAEKNVGLKIAYPYEPEKNVKKTMDFRAKNIAPEELLAQSEEILTYLTQNYPDFSFDGKIAVTETETSLKNDEGLELLSTDRYYVFSLVIKDNNLANIFDLSAAVEDREFDKEKILRITEQYLKAFRKEVEIPEEAYVILPPYYLFRQLEGDLSGKNLGCKTSLLAGKVGEKVYSDKVTIYTSADRTEDFIGTPFFDMEGKFNEKKCKLVDKGVFVKPFADKRVAEKYGYVQTGSADGAYDDVPSITGMENLQFESSDQTLKELLNGKPGLLIDIASGGDFTSSGDFATPVQLAYLTDGEQILGKVPEFHISGNIFDLLGEGYLGYSKDKELTGDRVFVLKMKIS